MTKSNDDQPLTTTTTTSVVIEPLELGVEKDQEKDEFVPDETTELKHEDDEDFLPNVKKMEIESSSNISGSKSKKLARKFQICSDVGKREACKKRAVSLIKIIWAFVSFVIATTDVIVIIVVARLHFVHQHDVLAYMMLAPILLNFIGISTFLNNESERRELERLAGSCTASTLVKNLMILPVFGPAISSLRLFFYAIEEKDAEKFERLESLLIKMKQYESFFRASPEAFIQMTYRIVSWETARPFESEDYWTSACLILCVFALAESNFYGVVRPYYRIFTDPAKLPEESWNTENISIPWRVSLFFYTYASILCRLLCDAILRATICFVFQKFGGFSFGEMIAITFLIQFTWRMLIHAFLLRPRENLIMTRNVEPRNPNAHPVLTRADVDYESGPVLYRASTYSWRSIFMAFDFQNPDRWIWSWFWIENVLMLVMAYAAALVIEYDLREKAVYFTYTGLALGGMAVAFAIRLCVYCWWNGRKNASVRNSPPKQVLVVED